MKICSKCKLEKPLEDFYKSKKGLHGHKSQCKICDRDYHKEWVGQNSDKIAIIDKRWKEENKPKLREKSKAWKKRNPEWVNAQRLKVRYGLTVVQYQLLLAHGSYCCYLCRRPQEANDLGLHVDHNHSNNNVRGMLCPSCNQALGLLKDNPALCRQAAIYLEDDGVAISHILKDSHETEETVTPSTSKP